MLLDINIIFIYSSASYLKHLVVLLLQNPIKINMIVYVESKLISQFNSLFTSSVIINPHACLGGKKTHPQESFFPM